MPIPTQAATLTLPCPATSELVDRVIVAAVRVVVSVSRAVVVVRPMALTTPIRWVKEFHHLDGVSLRLSIQVVGCFFAGTRRRGSVIYWFWVCPREPGK
jgi:hypothetical protein